MEDIFLNYSLFIIHCSLVIAAVITDLQLHPRYPH